MPSLEQRRYDFFIAVRPRVPQEISRLLQFSEQSDCGPWGIGVRVKGGAAPKQFAVVVRDLSPENVDDVSGLFAEWSKNNLL